MQTDIKLLLKEFKGYISKQRNLRGKGKRAVGKETEGEGYVIVDEYIYMILPEMGRYGTNKRQKEAKQVNEYIAVIMWLMNKEYCIGTRGGKCLKRNIEFTEDLCLSN